MIVVSILFAFWIDSTWDEHKALEEERVILSTLLVELRNVQADLVNYADYLPEIRESLRRLLEFGRDPKTTVSDDQIDTWLADASWNGARTALSVPALDSLTDGGNLYRISNNELRVLITQLHQLVERQRADVNREQLFIDNRYNAYVDGHASLGQIFGADDGQPGSPESIAYPTSGIEMHTPPIKVSHRDLLLNLEFQNLLSRRIELVTQLIGWDDGAFFNNALSATINAIEQELEN